MRCALRRFTLVAPLTESKHGPRAVPTQAETIEYCCCGDACIGEQGGGSGGDLPALHRPVLPRARLSSISDREPDAGRPAPPFTAAVRTAEA